MKLNNDIQEGYCSFEVSKLLKEKGFWVQTHDKCWVKTLDDEIIYNGNKEQHHRAKQWIMHPTHALAIEWIRVNFGIWIYIGCKEKEDGSGDVWYIPCGRNLPIKKSGQFIIDTIPYLPRETPQEATEAALLFTLKKLIP